MTKTIIFYNHHNTLADVVDKLNNLGYDLPKYLRSVRRFTPADGDIYYDFNGDLCYQGCVIIDNKNVTADFGFTDKPKSYYLDNHTVIKGLDFIDG